MFFRGSTRYWQNIFISFSSFYGAFSLLVGPYQRYTAFANVYWCESPDNAQTSPSRDRPTVREEALEHMPDRDWLGTDAGLTQDICAAVCITEMAPFTGLLCV